MKQPELGIKVQQLRQEKAITQAQLAEQCEVSTRTVQRIENGEVDPRSFTIQRLNEVLGFDFSAGDIDHETFWLAALHLSSMFCIILIPLLIWSLMKDRNLKIDRHGRDVLNFQITITIILFVALFFMMLGPVALIFFEDSMVDITKGIFVLVVSVTMIFIGFFIFFQGIKNTLKVLAGNEYHYPLSIRFLK